MKRMILVLLVLMLGLVFMGCPPPDLRLAVAFAGLSANGTSGTVTTTALTLTFDVEPTSLAVDDITVTGATKGALTRTGTSRCLMISDITVANGENVTVAIANPAGFTITPASREVAVNVVPTAVVFFPLTANGTSNITTTTELSLTFNIDPVSLTAADITVLGATKGALTGTGTSRSLAISAITVANGENVSVTIANPAGFTITPASRNVSIKTMLNLVSVPGGTFQRDATATNTSSVSSFRMSQYEITRAQFTALMETDPSNATYSSGAGDPVQMTNWYHAIAFCNKLSIAEGLTPVYSVSGVNFSTLTYADIPTPNNATWDAAAATWTNTGYRLPTEMEWMWAAMGARAGATGYSKAFAGSTGSNAIGDYTWYSVNSANRTHPVGTKQPNELGLYDLSGNVWEWCWDWYAGYSTGDRIDYRGAASGTSRVRRGGSWGSNASYCTVAIRRHDNPAYQNGDIGFRVVRP